MWSSNFSWNRSTAMLQCAYLLYLSFSLECFGRLSLPINHFSSTSARFPRLPWSPLSSSYAIMGLKVSTKDGCISLSSMTSHLSFCKPNKRFFSFSKKKKKCFFSFLFSCPPYLQTYYFLSSSLSSTFFFSFLFSSHPSFATKHSVSH